MNVIVSIMRTFAVALVLILTATGLWASGAEEEPAAAADKEMVTDPATGKMVTAPEYGGTLIFARPNVHATPDAWHTSGGATHWHSPVIEKLVMGDWAIDRDEYGWRTYNVPLSRMRGFLAESWEMPDDITIIAHIRPGVHWHDKAPMDGRELTASDVEFNFHRIWGLGDFTDAGPSPMSGRIEDNIESVTATDKYTVVFRLKQLNLGAQQNILDGMISWLYPPEVIKEHGDIRDWRNLVGTGPYELTDVVEGSSLTWTRVPNYWGFDEKFSQNRLPYIDEINALIMLESATRLAALRSGKVDMLGAFGDSHLKELDQVISLGKTNPEIELWPFRFRSSNAFAFNNVNNRPFNDIRVRQAMQMALDLETINETYFSGLGDATPHGFVDNSSMAGTPFDEWPKEVKKTYSYDPEGAEALLDEAGLPRGADGIRFKTILRPHPRADANYSELSTIYWREIGVEVELLVVADEGAYGAFYWENRTDDMLTAVAAITYSALRAMHSFTTGGEWNPTFANDPEFDALWEAANTASTAEEQARWAKAASMYMTEQHWLLIGPVTPPFNVSQPWVKGYNGEIGLGTMQHGNLFARLWIDSELKEAMGY